jgi:hypothetical protein
MVMIKPPATNPCGSCPYRRNVPSGVWDPSEYEKLPPYDNETPFQPGEVFMCHQQDGCLCAGWVAVHDMRNSLGLRMAVVFGQIDPTHAYQAMSYTTETPLFSSGQEARDHGMAEVQTPGPRARAVVAKLERKKAR